MIILYLTITSFNILQLLHSTHSSKKKEKKKIDKYSTYTYIIINKELIIGIYL
jgi:hypothetical protein